MNSKQSLHSRVSTLNADVSNDTTVDVEVTTSNTYSVTIQNKYVARDFLSVLRRLMREASAQRVVVLSDKNVGKIIAKHMIKEMEEDGLQVDAFFMPVGERSKSTDMLVTLWKQLKETGIERRSLILGIGGGVVCDIAGLVAATYLRGLPYMLVPTSLMAQVDAAIGGKVGADFLSTKNWIGSFYHPIGVTMFTEHLNSLSDEEFSNGMAELIKVGAIMGSTLWDNLEGMSTPSLRNDLPTLTRLIQTGFTAKLNFLAPDPFEVSSLDRELNFGHCLGHAIEAASDFELRHGFAVAIGMAMALRIGYAKGISDKSLLYAMEVRLKAHNLPTVLPISLIEDSWSGVEDLRKVRNGALRMAIPSTPGKTVFINDVTFSEFKKAASYV